MFLAEISDGGCGAGYTRSKDLVRRSNSSANDIVSPTGSWALYKGAARGFGEAHSLVLKGSGLCKLGAGGSDEY